MSWIEDNGTVMDENIDLSNVVGSPAGSIFRGAFTRVCDKEALVEVVEALAARTCARLREINDVPSWRELLAHRRSMFAGSSWNESSAGNPQNVEGFLARYELPSVNSTVERGMRAIHYAAYEDDADVVQSLVAQRAHVGCRNDAV